MAEEHTAYELTTDLLCLEEVAARREKEGKQEAANLLRAAALLLTKTARITALEAEKATLIASWKREEDSWIERNAKLEAEKEQAVSEERSFVQKAEALSDEMKKLRPPDILFQQIQWNGKVHSFLLDTIEAIRARSQGEGESNG